MPASRQQDHTTSPSADSAFVSCATSVHRIPHPTFSDDRPNAPLGGCETGELLKVICPSSQAKCLRQNGTTGKSVDCLRTSSINIFSCPGRGAARSAAPQIRDPRRLAPDQQRNTIARRACGVAQHPGSAAARGKGPPHPFGAISGCTISWKTCIASHRAA
jgi:hypothetical protein